MGQTGLDVVQAKMDSFATVEERKKFAEAMLLRDAFIFETPGPTVSLATLFSDEIHTDNNFFSVRRARVLSVVNWFFVLLHFI